MQSSIQFGRVFGIPIGINYSWLAIFVLVTLSLSMVYFPSSYPDWPVAVTWAIGVATSLLFFISVLIHELSHSVVSVAQGVPVKSITLFIFGGVSNISAEPRRARDEFWMAIAGPGSSLILGILFGLGWILLSPVYEPIAALCRWLAGINVSLAVFNLIPGFPLDGGRVLRSIVWGATGNPYKATRAASILGQIVAYLFILVGFFMALRGNWDGLWLAFVGWFLENAASQSYRQVALREALHGTTAGELMTRECSMIPADLPVDRFVNEYLLTQGRRCFLVTATDEHLTGMITLGNVKDIPKSEWRNTTIDKAMTPLANLRRVKPTDDAATVLDMMDAADVNQLPVVEDDHLIGLIGRDAMLRFIRTRTELNV
jgi:Zn-dependent protease/CBS domain-containing protein